jgi:hypothetical protein
MGPGAPGYEERTAGVGVETPCRLKDLASSVVRERVVDQDHRDPLPPVPGPLKCPHRVFGKQLPTNPEVGTERALQLSFDPPQQTRIRIDRQKQRPVTPLSDGHDTRLGKGLLEGKEWPCPDHVALGGFDA